LAFGARKKFPAPLFFVKFLTFFEIGVKISGDWPKIIVSVMGLLIGESWSNPRLPASFLAWLKTEGRFPT